MRVVLDTNVLIAALISPGVCAELLEHCVLSHSIVGSDFILQELRENLLRKFKYDPTDADAAVTLFRSGMEIVIPVTFERPICRDPDDDAIIGTAVAGQAGCLITGDKDLLILQQYQGIVVVAPKEFADVEENFK